MHTPARPANSRRCATAVVVGLVTVWLLALSTPPAAAHPLGNFTINTYAGLRVAPDVVAIDFVVDLAEVATTQSRGFADTDGDGQLDPGEWADYARAGCGRWAREIRLVEQDAPLDLRVVDVGHEVQPGEGGVPTLRSSARLTRHAGARRDPRGSCSPTRPSPTGQGWREVTAVGDHATLTSSTVPVHSSSDRLTAYPDAGLEDPVDVRTAELLVEPGGPAAPTPAAAGGDGTAAATILGGRRMGGSPEPLGGRPPAR